MKNIDKNTVFAVALCFFTYVSAVAEDADAQELKSTYWGFSGAIEMGYMGITGDGLEMVADSSYGTINGSSLVVLLSAGLNYRKVDTFDVALTVSYLGGGAFVWEDIFGEFGADFPLYGDSLAAQLEIQPLFPSLSGFHPFIGGGYSVTNGLVDEIKEGFVQGRGPFIVGGLYILNNLGLGSILPFYTERNHYVGMRVSVYYRLPYSYRFRLDWDEFAVNYHSPGDLPAMQSFFENTFPASSFAFGIGLSLGYMPFRFGGRL